MALKIILKFRTFFSRHLSPARIFILSFAAVIITGAILLWFPFSIAKEPLRFVDVLFSSISAVCVTGLVVIDADKNKEVIQKVKDFSTKAILADRTDKEVLESIGIQEDDVVIISFGEDLATSTLITLHLREMKGKNIIVKAFN